MITRVKITGAAELQKKLRGLPDKVAKKHIRAALRKGAKIIRDEARRLAPKDTGHLVDSIKVRAAKRMKRGSFGIQVITGAGDFAGDEFYASFYEYGYRKNPAYRGADGKIRSVSRTQAKSMERTEMKPRPFMRPAADSKGQLAAEIVKSKLLNAIVKEAKAKS